MFVPISVVSVLSYLIYNGLLNLFCLKVVITINNYYASYRKATIGAVFSEESSLQEQHLITSTEINVRFHEDNKLFVYVLLLSNILLLFIIVIIT